MMPCRECNADVRSKEIGRQQRDNEEISADSRRITQSRFSPSPPQPPSSPGFTTERLQHRVELLRGRQRDSNLMYARSMIYQHFLTSSCLAISFACRRGEIVILAILSTHAPRTHASELPCYWLGKTSKRDVARGPREIEAHTHPRQNGKYGGMGEGTLIFCLCHVAWTRGGVSFTLIKKDSDLCTQCLHLSALSQDLNAVDSCDHKPNLTLRKSYLWMSTGCM